MNIIERQQRELNEPAEKVCPVCQLVKPTTKFKRIPIGGRSHICRECITQKKKEKDKRTIASEETIQEELWKQYDKAHSTSEKIRCLEALVKLRPADKASSLDEASVVASLMKSLKAKKNRDSTSANGE